MEIDHEALVKSWLRWDKNEKTREAVREMWVKKDYEAIKSRLYYRLKFGSAGVQTKLEAGFCFLNDLTVVMLTHGFATHLKGFFRCCIIPTVVIGFDGHPNSKRWADLAANVFIFNGIKVFQFSRCCPISLVSFATINSNCSAGLMITSSHNPEQINSYKVFWANGAQILEPHESEICRIAYEMNLDDRYWDTPKFRSHPLFTEADFEFENYFKQGSSLCRYKSLNKNCPVRFTYSAFHDVGLPFASRMLEEFGFRPENVILVQEQPETELNFPTVSFPNREKAQEVVTIPFAVAEKNHSTVILANNPDASRFQFAERQTDGKWKVFTGNEMGALMCWWVWHCWREENPDGDPSNVYILNSLVSSSIARTIAATEGFQVEQCLTGLRYLGNSADELIGGGKQVILAWEGIGFIVSSSTREKDGITTAARFAELASYSQMKGLTLTEQLFNIYKKYGYHLICSSCWIVPNLAVSNKIFQKIRQDKKYPRRIGKFDVKYVRDLTAGYDNEQPGNKPILPFAVKSNVITFTSPNGSWITLTGSDTRPLIKYYIEFKSPPNKSEKDLARMQTQLREWELAVIDNLLEPKLNGLIARTRS